MQRQLQPPIGVPVADIVGSTSYRPNRVVVVPRVGNEKLGIDLGDEFNEVAVIKIFPGMAAAKCGHFMLGDIILTVRTHPIAGMSRNEVYALIAEQPLGPITFQVRNSEYVQVVVPRQLDQKLGLDMIDVEGRCVAVSKIHAGFAVADGGLSATTRQLCVGDLVRGVCGEPTSGWTRDAVYQAIAAQPPGPISLIVKAAPIKCLAIPRVSDEKVGLDLVVDSGACMVSKVHAGFAAAAGGHIQPGDLLLMVGEVPTMGLNRDDVYQLVGSSPPGPVILGMRQVGSITCPGRCAECGSCQPRFARGPYRCPRCNGE